MNRYDCLDVRCRRQRLLEQSWRHPQRVAIDVDEASFSSGIEKAICRCRKSNRRGQTAVAGADARSQTGNVKTRGPTAHRDRMAGTDPLGQGAFKALDRRALREKIATEYRYDRIDIGLIDALSSIAECRRRHPNYSMTAFNCFESSHCVLLSLAYSKSAATGRPRSSP